MGAKTYGDTLSLREAAEFAGVTEPTMRLWVKEVTNVSRNNYGAYLIPRSDLTAYLGEKAHRKAGATAGGAKHHGAEDKGGNYSELYEALKRERDRAIDEANFLRGRVTELEGQMGRLSSDLASLSREFFELAFRGGQPGLSTWLSKVKAQHEPKVAAPKTAVVRSKAVPVRKTKKKAARKVTTKSKPKKR